MTSYLFRALLLYFLTGGIFFISSCQRKTLPPVVQTDVREQEIEDKKIARKLNNLGKQMAKIQQEILELKVREPDGNEELLKIPLDKLEKRLEGEVSLFNAFGLHPEDDDLEAMKERLDLIDKRLSRVLKSYQAIEKELGELYFFIDRMQKEIQELIALYPNSHVDDLLHTLEDVEKELEKEKSMLESMDAQTQMDDIDALFQRLNKQEEIIERTRKSYRYAKDLHISLETNALFSSGQFQLSPQGQRRLDVVVKDTRRSIERFKKQFPEDTLSLFIQVEGYADTQAFYEGQPLPERKAQNLKISQSRAESLGNYLQDKLKSWVSSVETEFIGHGEDLPPGVEAGPVDDPKRRICTLSMLIFNQSGL